MGVNAQNIKQFNQRNQQNAILNKQPVNQNTPQVNLNSKMSVSDIALLQKDPATLSKEEAIRRKALETRETLREREETEERQRQEQLDADRKAGRIKEVAAAEAVRGLRALDKSTASQRAWIMRAPTVGGIGVLLAIIALFLMAVVPVDKSGNTRLFLLWLTLTGKASVKLPTGTVPGGSGDVTQNINTEVPVAPTPVVPDITTTTFTLPSVFNTNGTSLLGSIFGE